MKPARDTIADACGIETTIGEHLLTADSRIVGGFAAGGIDTSAFAPGDHLKMAIAIENIHAGIPDEARLTQYRIRVPQHPPQMPALEHDAFSRQIRDRRQRRLESENYLETKIYHLIDRPIGAANFTPSILKTAKNLLRGAFLKPARDDLAASLDGTKLETIAKKTIEKAALALTEIIEIAANRAESLFPTHPLSAAEIIGLTHWLCHPMESPAPIHTNIQDFSSPGAWLGNGEIAVAKLDGETCLKLTGPTTLWMRVASVTASGSPTPGLWATGEPLAIADLPFPHAHILRWERFGPVQTQMLFDTKRRQIQRSGLEIASMLTGTSGEKARNLPTALRAKFDELDKAETLQTRWTNMESTFLVWAEDAANLAERCRKLSIACADSSIKIVWETTNCAGAWRRALPSAPIPGLRKIITNSCQNAALALIHRAAPGTTEDGPVIDIFPAADGSLFQYQPWVGGRALALGIGPTRSGKTFAKNALALQTLRFDSTYTAFDVDPGTKPLAEMLGDRAAYFEIGSPTPGAGKAGFNLFASSTGKGDIRWRTHFIAQIRRMCAADETPAPDTEENAAIDEATDATLALAPKLQTLSHFAAHLPPALAKRLSRWLRADHGAGREHDGPYAWLTDSPEDNFLSNRDFRVYNFAALRDTEELRGIAYAEIFHRVTADFEKESARARMKFLDIDEAHIPLSDPEFAKWIVRGARTWNKFRVGVSLWSQSLEEFTSLEQFEALRTAAATLFFTANPGIDHDAYAAGLGLAEGECKAIGSLIRRRELQIIQREAGVSRTVDIRVDKWTEALLRSDPEHAAKRNALIEKIGILPAIDAMAGETPAQAAACKAAA